jgi:hypothetical protein
MSNKTKTGFLNSAKVTSQLEIPIAIAVPIYIYNKSRKHRLYSIRCDT